MEPLAAAGGSFSVFLGVIYYEELFLKLYCFQSLSFAGAVFTLLFSIPIAMLLGGLVRRVEGPPGTAAAGPVYRPGFPLDGRADGILSPFQDLFDHLFPDENDDGGGAFGNMAMGEILLNWFPILMMVVPVVLAAALGKRLLPGCPMGRRRSLRWLALGLGVQLAGIVLVLFCGGGVLSAVYLFPGCGAGAGGTELQDVHPDRAGDPSGAVRHRPGRPDPSQAPGAADPPLDPGGEVPAGEEPKLHTMDIDFQALMERDREDPELSAMHSYFSR